MMNVSKIEKENFKDVTASEVQNAPIYYNILNYHISKMYLHVFRSGEWIQNEKKNQMNGTFKYRNLSRYVAKWLQS